VDLLDHHEEEIMLAAVEIIDSISIWEVVQGLD
jgi:hypothetical protein